MPTLTQIKTRVNARTVALWTLLQARQEAYIQNNGIYWQGRITPRQIPAFSETDGRPLAADKTGDVAGSHSVSWDTMLPEVKNTPLSAQLQVDTYKSSRGYGYALTMRLLYKGRLFSRTKHYGPETYIDESWREIDTSED